MCVHVHPLCLTDLHVDVSKAIQALGNVMDMYDSHQLNMTSHCLTQSKPA